MACYYVVGRDAEIYLFLLHRCKYQVAQPIAGNFGVLSHTRSFKAGDRSDAALQIPERIVRRVNENERAVWYPPYQEMPAKMLAAPFVQPVAPFRYAGDNACVPAPGQLYGKTEWFAIHIEHAVGAAVIVGS